MNDLSVFPPQSELWRKISTSPSVAAIIALELDDLDDAHLALALPAVAAAIRQARGRMTT